MILKKCLAILGMLLLDAKKSFKTTGSSGVLFDKKYAIKGVYSIASQQIRQKEHCRKQIEFNYCI